MNRVLVVLCLAACLARPSAAQDPPVRPQSTQVLRELRVEGATVYKSEDVLWLLRLHEGAALPDDADAVARRLQERYDRDGYSAARVTGRFEAGRLTLTVDEGRIDDIELIGVAEREAGRVRRILGIQPGDIYNTRVAGRAAGRLERQSGGALAVRRPHRWQPGADRPGEVPDKIGLERRGPRNIMVVPIQSTTTRSDTTLGSGREDLFSPADGLAPAIGFSATIFDAHRFNHSYLDAYVSYKFGREEPGYSFGAERPVFGGPRLFVGGEVHDITTSDDLWRVTTFEQSLASVFFKNSFRDYYRRKGTQIFTVLRTGAHNEFSAAARWDRHQPLANATSYSFFRDDAEFRPALPVRDQQVNALVVGYTFDTRSLSGAGTRTTYARHLKDSLFGFASRREPGVRLEWTAEIAGRGLGGDARFDRHILNARGYVPIGSRTLLSMRGIFGGSRGELPVERLFSIGGIGSVHGYSFKEASGTSMALLNAEYTVFLEPAAHQRDTANVFVFYDAGRVGGQATNRDWLNGIGVGIGGGGVRLEFGFRADAIPRSRQILLRFSPTF